MSSITVLEPPRISAGFEGHGRCVPCNDIWGRKNPAFTWILQLSPTKQLAFECPELYYIGTTGTRHYPLPQRMRDEWINEHSGDLWIPGSGLIDPTDPVLSAEEPKSRANRRRAERSGLVVL